VRDRNLPGLPGLRRSGSAQVRSYKGFAGIAAPRIGSSAPIW